jgi:hypothetical protein
MEPHRPSGTGRTRRGRTRGCVAAGKGGLGTFAPPLDRAGNSVRGPLAAAFLSRALGLDLFISEPEARGGQAS